MKPESRAALLKAQSAVEEAYRVCLEEAIGADTHEKRVKITNAVNNLPHYARELAEMVDPKPKQDFLLGGLGQYVQNGQQAEIQKLYTQGGGTIKNTAAW